MPASGFLDPPNPTQNRAAYAKAVQMLVQSLLAWVSWSVLRQLVE